MSFGLLSGAQMALVAGASAALIVAIFFLKVRHPAVVVPSLALWHRVLDERRRDSWIERLRRILSLMLALAIGLGLAAAVGDPRGADGPGGRIGVVVDNGPTMAARGVTGATRLDDARTAARALVSAAGAGARFQVADTLGAVLTPPDLGRHEALAAIDAVALASGPPAVPRLADGAAVSVFTDGAAFDPPSGVRIVRVGEPGPNVGITAFEVRAVTGSPGQHEAFLAIANFGDRAADVTLVMGGADRAPARRRMALAGRGRVQEVVPLAGVAPGAIEARVSAGDDVLPADDVAYAWLPDTRVRVRVVTAGNEALLAALRAIPGVEVEAPSEPDGGGETDVLVVDRLALPEPPSSPAWLIDPPSTDWLPRGAAVTDAALQMVAPDHPLVADLPREPVQVEQGSALAAPGQTVLAAAGGVPLITTGGGAAPWVATGFAIEASTLPASPAFPIFVAGVLAAFQGEGDPIVARPGLVSVPMAGAEVTDADGSPVRAWPGLAGTVFRAERPGVFVARRDGRRIPIVVNLSDASASNRVTGAVTSSAPADPAAPPSGAGLLWRGLVLAVFALLVLEWWTWQRRITL